MSTRLTTSTSQPYWSNYATIDSGLTQQETGYEKHLRIKIEELKSMVLTLENRLNSAYTKMEEQSKMMEYFIDMVNEGELK